MPTLSYSRLISKAAEDHPSRPAVTVAAASVTRSQLERRTNRRARAYQRLGVMAGDFVIVALPNSIAFVEACVSLWKLGATPQPVSARLPEIELLRLIALAHPKLVICEGVAEIGGTRCVGADFGIDEQLGDEPLPDVTARRWKAVASGGSTGQPKLIVSESAGELDPDVPTYHAMLRDRVHLVPGPLYHNGPFTLAMLALMRGNHLVVLPRFDALESLGVIEQFGVDWVFLVPTMMQRIRKLEATVRDSYDLSTLRVVFHSASACPAWLKREWIEWLGAERIIEMYGGTENIGTTRITGAEWLAHPGSVGKLLPGSQIRILDAERRPLPPGEAGEIFFLPDGGSASRYHYIGAEPNRIDGGWESLGDVGYLDPDGFLYLCDRTTDVIACGGAKVFPAEVEAAIDAHAEVKSCVVIGLPHEDLGHVVHAIVECHGSLTAERLAAHLTDRLAPYKIPRTFEFVDGPVRDDAGKVRRSGLVAARVALPPKA